MSHKYMVSVDEKAGRLGPEDGRSRIDNCHFSGQVDPEVPRKKTESLLYIRDKTPSLCEHCGCDAVIHLDGYAVIPIEEYRHLAGQAEDPWSPKWEKQDD